MTGLRDSSLGIGYHATWPATLGVAGIPIDHVLVSAGIGVAEKSVAAGVGSDHLPIVVDLWIEADDRIDVAPAGGEGP